MTTLLLDTNRVAMKGEGDKYIYQRNNIWWEVDAETNEWSYLEQGSADFTEAIAVPGEEQHNIRFELEKLFEQSTCEALARYKENGEVYRCLDDNDIPVVFVHSETGLNFAQAMLLFGTKADYVDAMKDIIVLNEYIEGADDKVVTVVASVINFETHLPSYVRTDSYKNCMKEAYNDWKYDR